jgi:LysM repeat protein
MLVGALSAGALSVMLALRVRGLLAGHTGPWRVDAAVEIGVTSAGLLVAVWLACSALVATMCLLVRVAGTTWRTGERFVHRYAPQVVRKALVLAVGAGIGLGIASGATAAAPEPAPTVTTSGSSTSAVGPAVLDDLGWVVTEPAETPHQPTPTAVEETGTALLAGTTTVTASPEGAPTLDTAAATTLVESAATPGTVVVESGDSLWAIAARHLPPDASDAQIAAAWPRWYEANAVEIGADPDLIRQGQVLVAPASVAEAAR